MKLTATQIKEALDWLGPPRHNTDDPERFACRDALSAYERVTAWAESCALDAVITSRHLSLDVREAVKGCRDEVRCALYGDADDKAGG